MTHFEEMKTLFERLGLYVRAYPGEGIDVIDSEGKKAEFSFEKDGSFSKSGYYTEERGE